LVSSSISARVISFFGALAFTLRLASAVEAAAVEASSLVEAGVSPWQAMALERH
jgi:hypothetical protein